MVVVAACGTDDDATSVDSTTATTNPALNAPSDPFYVPPDPLPDGAPGDVIRSEPLDGAPAGAQAWRVLYLSQGVDGNPTAVSGMVIAPAGPAPAGGRPVLSWAHPTTGVVDSCAPSTLPLVFTLVAGLERFLDAGYVVAATDYEGLGTPGVHPYLIGESEGRSVLDAARAARNLSDTGASDQLLLWGHSQGGQASLFAAQLAPSYAPELRLVATAAAAPAGELAELLDLDSSAVEGVILGSYSVNAYAEVYRPQYPEISVTQVLTPDGATVVPELVRLCDLTQYDQMEAIATPLAGTFFVDDPGAVPPWGTLLDENSPGRTKIDSPVLITQGSADTLVIPSATNNLVQTYCANGTNVALKTYDGATHTMIGYQSADDVAAWMAQVLAGGPATPPSSCA